MVTQQVWQGNLVFSGVIGVDVDASSGAMYDLEPGSVHADLKKAKKAKKRKKTDETPTPSTQERAIAHTEMGW